MNASEQKTTTAEALLGMLSMGPMSGYDLKQRIEGSIGNFWSESFGQIYPTLRRLEEEGAVSSAEEGKAGRKVYALTEAGRDRLEEWLGISPRPRVPRNEMLLKLFFGSNVTPETTLRQVGEFRAQFAAEVDRYEATGTFLQRTYAGQPGLPYWMMTLSYGRREARMIVEWCDETLDALGRVSLEGSTAAGKLNGRDRLKAGKEEVADAR